MIVDAIVLGVLLVSAVFAFLRGFIREVLTILGVAGGLAAAIAFGEKLLPYMQNWLGYKPDAKEAQMVGGVIPLEAVAQALSYGSIFLIVVIILSIISHLLAGWARTIGLGAVDRTLGVIFGIARGVLVLAVLYLLPYLLFEDASKNWTWLKDSKTIVYIEATSKWLAGFLPDYVRNPEAGDMQGRASSLAKDTREKLKDLELLKDDSKQTDQPAIEEEGYGKDIRQNMRELILEQTEGVPPAMPEQPLTPETVPPSSSPSPSQPPSSRSLND